MQYLLVSCTGPQMKFNPFFPYIENVFDHSSVSGAFLLVFHYRQDYLVMKTNFEGLYFMQDLVERAEPHPYCTFAHRVGLGRGWRFCKRDSLQILDLQTMASL